MSQRRRSGRARLMGNHQRSWIWGRHAVLESLRGSRWRPLEVRLSDELPPEVVAEAAALAAGLGVGVARERPERLQELCKSREHQGLVARLPAYPYLGPEELLRALPGAPCLLVLDAIQDAFNFGAILRSAEVFGVDAVVVGVAGQCEVTSQVVRSSAGAAHHVPIARAEPLADCLGALAVRGVQLVAATEKGSVRPQDVDCRGPVAIVIGNEGRGIDAGLLALCHRAARIPQRGRVGSLNAAVAAGVLLYEVARQRAGG